MSIYDLLKDSASILKEAGKIEQYNQILEVQGKLLDMQNTIQDLTSQNKDLREKLDIKENLVAEDNLYYVLKNSRKEGPYCTCCYDSSDKLVRLHRNPNTGSLSCPNCKTYASHAISNQFNNSRNDSNW